MYLAIMPRMAYDEDLADRIRELLAGEAGVTEKRMFGGLAFLVGGHMAVAASGQGGPLVRIDPENSETLAGKPHTRPKEVRAREMRGLAAGRPRGRSDQAAARTVGQRRVAYARSLPPKR